jgi:peptide/nickel transport system substrate-binding protein
MTDIAPLDADSVTRDPNLSLVSVPSLGYGALTINTGQYPKAETPIGRDSRVRHAFELSLDREALSQVVYGGMYQPNAQATSAISPLYVQEVAPRRDVGKRALLKEAGVTTPLAPLIVYNTPQNVLPAK